MEPPISFIMSLTFGQIVQWLAFIAISYFLVRYALKTLSFTVGYIGELNNGGGVEIYEELEHKARLGGYVRNPQTGDLQLYDENHPLWKQS